LPSGQRRHLFARPARRLLAARRADRNLLRRQGRAGRIPRSPGRRTVMKPPIDIDHFRKLDLRVGTVTAVRRHPSIGDLSILTVLLDEAVEVLAPASLTEGYAPGSRVVVATGLHTLSAGDLRFNGCLAPVTIQGESAASPRVAAKIPDGS